jgi:hypothetical protein
VTTTNTRMPIQEMTDIVERPEAVSSNSGTVSEQHAISQKRRDNRSWCGPRKSHVNNVTLNFENRAKCFLKFKISQKFSVSYYVKCEKLRISLNISST